MNLVINKEKIALPNMPIVKTFHKDIPSDVSPVMFISKRVKIKEGMPIPRTRIFILFSSSLSRFSSS